MTYNAPTPDDLREAARNACEGQPESDLHKHPAWRTADLIEQEGHLFLAGTGTPETTPVGIMNYDPNITNSGGMAKQTVRLTFGVENYRKETEVVIGGNCTGLTVIEAAVSRTYDDLDDSEFSDEDDRWPCIHLDATDDSGDTLTCEDDDDKGEDWLKDMLIKAEIIDIQPDDSI